MAKKIDITDKLELGGNPFLLIKGKEIEVNADAATMLKIIDKFKDSETQTASAKDIMEIYEVIFPDKARKELDKMKLSFIDLEVVIRAAQKLIMGEDPNTPDEEDIPGESQTHTTT